jgi:hypothetical protein
MLKKSLLSLAAALFLFSVFIPGAFAFKGNCTHDRKIVWRCVKNTKKMTDVEFRSLRRQIYNKWHNNPKKYAKDYKKINKIMLERAANNAYSVKK